MAGCEGERMMQISKTAKGAWQISAPVTNQHTTWVEIRTFYGIDEKQAIASFYNAVWSMGWEPVL
jgi:hypothetical protein